MVEFTDENIQRLFGVEDAENERPERLKEYFFRNKAYSNLTANLPIRLIVGHKGSGKSALLKIARLEDLDAGHIAVWLQPDDLRGLLATNSQDLNVLIDQWKTGLRDLISRQIIADETAQDKDAHIGSVILQEARNIAEPIVSAITTRIAGLDQKLRERIINRVSRSKSIRVYIDDLDRGWEARVEDIRRISALLNAVRDLAGEDADRKLQFRIGLRSDVYYLVRTSDESTDKLEQNVIRLTWNRHEILVVAAKRIETFFGRTVNEADLIKNRQSEVGRYLHKIITPVFAGAGKWHNAPIHRVLLSLNRNRPRDFVKLMSGAAKEAFRNNSETIQTSDLKATFESYSNERLQDIVNEFKSELPNIQPLLLGMRPSRRERSTLEQFLFTNDALMKKLKNVMSQANFRFTNNRAITPHSLANFLYKIDFVWARRDSSDGKIERKTFDQNQYLQDQFADFGFKWEIHPAYRWALQPTDERYIYDLDLVED